MPKLPAERVSFLAPAVVRRFLVALLVVTLVLFVTVAAIYQQDVAHQREMLEQEAQHVTALQEKLLLFEFGAVRSDLRYLTTQQALQQFLADDSSKRSVLERNYVNFANNKAVYDQIRCLDITGHELIRINYRDGDAEIVPQERLQSKATRYYFQQALPLSAGEMFISSFDLNMEHGQIQRPIKPVMRFVTPVFDSLGEKRGLLVLNYLGAPLLSSLKQLASQFRGETMLLNSAGEYLQAQDPEQEWGWLLGHTRSFRDDFPEAWEEGNRLNSGPFRIAESSFSFQRVSPNRGVSGMQAGLVQSENDHDVETLTVVSYASPTVVKAHAVQLLGRIALPAVGVVAVVAALLLYWAHAGEVRRYHEQRIAASEGRLRQLSSLLLAAQEDERRSLSRDLHDELGQQVTAIRLDLRLLEKKGGHVASEQLLRRAIEETDQLLQSIHAVATRVRPSVLDDLGLGDAVESLLAEYQQRTGIDVISQVDLDGQPIPANVAENVYRILQEALANVATHAQARDIRVIIDVRDDVFHLTVRDSGVGFEEEDLRESTRLGILGMRERVELLGGLFDLETSRGKGTEIEVSIPLDYS